MENIALLDPLVYGAPPPAEQQEEEEEEAFSSANSLERSMFSSLLTGKATAYTQPVSVPASSQRSRQESTGALSFEESVRLHKQRCPALPCSGGLYDQYGNTTDTHSYRPSTSILDRERTRGRVGTGTASSPDHRTKDADAKFSELFQQGWTLSKVSALSSFSLSLGCFANITVVMVFCRVGGTARASGA